MQAERVLEAGFGGWLIAVIIIVVLALVGLLYLLRSIFSGRRDRL